MAFACSSRVELHKKTHISLFFPDPKYSFHQKKSQNKKKLQQIPPKGSSLCPTPTPPGAAFEVSWDEQGRDLFASVEALWHEGLETHEQKVSIKTLYRGQKCCFCKVKLQKIRAKQDLF